jgi:Tfp pilus assembly protein PilV
MSLEVVATLAVVLLLIGVLAIFGLGKYRAMIANEASERKAQAAQRERFTRAKPADDVGLAPKRVKSLDFGRR